MKETELTYYPDEQITAYLNNELSDEQRVELEQWVAADETHKQYYYEMTEVWLAVNAIQDKKEATDRAYQHFLGRISQKKKSKKLSFYFIRTAVAVLLGGLLIGSGFYLGNRQPDIPFSHAMQTVEVPLGSRSRIVLQDGTIVWLNAGSKLSYAAGFSPKERNVILEGEGYFEVTHNEKSPFMVRTNDIDIKVLGTRFSVKAYKDEESVEVILAEGTVNFINKNDLNASLIMKPEQQVIYDRESGRTNIRKVPVSQADDWTTGAHFFNELTLEQIARQLEKSFDVDFIFRNEEKKNLTFYGDFRSDDSLDDILMIMSSGGKFKYRKTHDKIEIY